MWGRRFCAAGRFFLAIFLVCMLSSQLPQMSLTALAATGTIKGNNVNVRAQAGTGAQKLCSLNAGTALTVLGSSKDANGKTWYQVSFTKEGKTYAGYVISDYVNYKADDSQVGSTSGDSQTEISAGGSQTSQSSTSQSSASQSSASQSSASGTAVKWTATVQATNVNVRDRAVSGNVVGKVSKAAQLNVFQSATGSDGKKWYYASFESDGRTQTGWIRSDFIKKNTSASSQSTGQTQTGSEIQTGGQTASDGQVQSGIGTSGTDSIKNAKAVMNAVHVCVRKKPVDGAVICKLSTGKSLTIKAQKKGSDGKIWYKVTFSNNGKKETGYVRSDFVTVKEKASDITVIDVSGAGIEPADSNQDEADGDDENGETDPAATMTDDEFEQYLVKQGFPNTYQGALRGLHKSHPTWVFRAVKTDLKWEDVIAAESRVGMNFVSKYAANSWKSTEKTAYDWKKNAWYLFDGGAWVAASPQIIRYYMDPRNFLTETGIFQFESLEYESYQNTDGVKKLLKGSFMSGDYKEPDGTVKSYADTFVEIGKKIGVSPYHLAARCYQEQGTGKSGSITGKVSGYENIFNYYNIGAYAANGNTPVVQGLIYASQPGSGNTGYGRPWNTRYKSLLGGAQYVSEKYVKLGQNTLYFQKFNVVNKKNGIYRHQYMTNLLAAQSEAVKMSKAYSETEASLVFYIPIYLEMPDEVSAKPEGTANPNNYLAALSVKNQELTPAFDADIDSYDLTVPKKVKKVEIEATAVASTSKVSGTGSVELERGENEVTVSCTSESGKTKKYVIHIVRE